jgi:hypothetical protein
VIEPLPKQLEFLNLKATHNLLVSGYGFGKTETKLIALMLDMFKYAKHKPTYALYDPTHDLLIVNTLPRLLEKLETLSVPYKLNKQEKIIRTPIGQIFLRSMDTPSRIIAYSSFRSYIDELETLRPKQIIDVWNKINGRNRQSIPNAKNRTYTFTTPDAGFGFTYEKWGKATDKTQFDYVAASTTDNPHLPADYVTNLLSIYPDGMVKAFIHGQWTNIAQGVVYGEFNRDKHHDTYAPLASDRLLIGQDFNVGACVSVIGVMVKGVLHIIGEMVSDNTYSIHAKLRQKYSQTATIHPDASGNQRSSNATTTDIEILRQHFQVVSKQSNPLVRERVLSVNSALMRGLIKIDTQACPRLTEALEKQAYTDNGEPEKSNQHPSLDDYGDAFGYLVYDLFPIRKPSAAVSFS